MTKINHNKLLESLSPSDLALLTPHLRTEFVNQGVLLQEADEPIEHIFFPNSGMISLLVVMRSGAAIEMATIGREGAVNAHAGLGGAVSASRGLMQISGEVEHISAAKFRAAVDASPTLRAFVARYADVHIALLQQTAGCNALHQVEARMCRWLLQTRDRCDSDAIPLTQEFLSEMLGVQRTSITPIARGLQAKKLIRYRRGLVDILDRAGLEAKSCECYDTVRRRAEGLFK